MMSFGVNLKMFRSEKNISQEELAKKVGIHPNHLSRYERGQASPSIEVVQKIADALEVSIDQLVFGKGSNLENNVSDRELVSLFKKVQVLSIKEKETVKDLLNAFVFKADVQHKLAHP
jgi:transcriptional regulator with XRE-family HTH domain